MQKKKISSKMKWKWKYSFTWQDLDIAIKIIFFFNEDYKTCKYLENNHYSHYIWKLGKREGIWVTVLLFLLIHHAKIEGAICKSSHLMYHQTKKSHFKSLFCFVFLPFFLFPLLLLLLLFSLFPLIFLLFICASLLRSHCIGWGIVKVKVCFSVLVFGGLSSWFSSCGTAIPCVINGYV